MQQPAGSSMHSPVKNSVPVEGNARHDHCSGVGTQIRNPLAKRVRVCMDKSRSLLGALLVAPVLPSAATAPATAPRPAAAAPLTAARAREGATPMPIVFRQRVATRTH